MGCRNLSPVCSSALIQYLEFTLGKRVSAPRRDQRQQEWEETEAQPASGRAETPSKPVVLRPGYWASESPEDPFKKADS